MTREEAIARLSRYQSQEDSRWRLEEERLQYAKTRGWLRYSRRIAIKVALAMKQQNLSRQDVAERMGCSPQYVSRLLKGEENLSLETICKLENALNVAILQYEFMRSPNLHVFTAIITSHKTDVLRHSSHQEQQQSHSPRGSSKSHTMPASTPRGGYAVFEKKSSQHAPYAKKLYLCTRKKDETLVHFFINIKKLKFYEKKS